MAYIKQNFVDGEVLGADQLNAMDDQIATNEEAIASNTAEIATKANISDLSGKQDKLTAGEGIDITGNVISATGGGGGGTVDPVARAGVAALNSTVYGDSSSFEFTWIVDRLVENNEGNIATSSGGWWWATDYTDCEGLSAIEVSGAMVVDGHNTAGFYDAEMRPVSTFNTGSTVAPAFVSIPVPARAKYFVISINTHSSIGGSKDSVKWNNPKGDGLIEKVSKQSEEIAQVKDTLNELFVGETVTGKAVSLDGVNNTDITVTADSETPVYVGGKNFLPKQIYMGGVKYDVYTINGVTITVDVENGCLILNGACTASSTIWFSWGRQGYSSTYKDIMGGDWTLSAKLNQLAGASIACGMFYSNNTQMMSFSLGTDKVENHASANIANTSSMLGLRIILPAINYNNFKIYLQFEHNNINTSIEAFGDIAEIKTTNFVHRSVVDDITFSSISEFTVSYSKSPVTDITNLNSDIEELKKKTDKHEYVVNCWGDSLTMGTGDNGLGYPFALANILGNDYDVINMGVGGEKVLAIMGRSGSMPIEVNNLTIPTTATPVEVHLKSSFDNTDVWLWLVGVTGLNPVSIGGIEGKITTTGTGNQTRYYFTRTVAGDSLVINRPTPIITEAWKIEESELLLFGWVLMAIGLYQMTQKVLIILATRFKTLLIVRLMEDISC